MSDHNICFMEKYEKLFHNCFQNSVRFIVLVAIISPFALRKAKIVYSLGLKKTVYFVCNTLRNSFQKCRWPVMVLGF